MDTTGLLRVRIFTPSLLVQHGIILLSLVGTVVLQSCKGTVNLSENETLSYGQESNLVCKWSITVDEGFVAVLRFQAFSITECFNCRCDYLAVHDGPDILGPRLVKICGSVLPSPIFASQNRMFVQFRSMYEVNYSGFTATITKGEILTQFIESDNGTIQSPNYPNNYEPDKRYVWKITVPENYQIFLEFLTFDVEESPYCVKDFVKVSDGNETASPVLGKFCGTNAVKYMRSSGNAMTIAFHTDDSKEARGFVAQFRKAEKCGTTMNGTSGNFTSPNYPSNYGPVERCSWKIVAPEDHQVLLTFLTFNVSRSSSCTKDFVRIYNANTKARTIGTYCGSRLPNVFKSTNSEILVVFESDADAEAQGFFASFETDLCQEEFHTDNGTFHTPNYPANSRSLEACSWKVTVTDGYRVALRFDSFKLISRSQCTEYFVGVFDGLNTSSRQLLKLCGEVSYRGKIYSSGNTLFVRYATYSTFSKPGFSASFAKAQIPPSGNTTFPTTDPCQQNMTSDSGTISSPRYPELYEPNMDCLWNVEVPAGNILRLDFQSFDVEEGGRRNCNLDFVRIYDGNSTSDKILGTYCGSNKPGTLWSSGNTLTVKFVSDPSFEHPGFSATYYKVNYEKKTLYANNGILKSPNFPNNYGPAQIRVWEITAPEGHIIFLRFLSFELEYSKNCSDDFVQVRDGNGIRKSLNRIFCGAITPNDMRTFSNTVTVIFSTDTSEELRGFSAKYETEPECGGASCRNGGTCPKRTKGIPRCSCKHGYIGYFCDEQVLCSSDTCEHGGTCFQNGTNGLFYCSCTHLYEGLVCHERILCGSDMCENGGTCTHDGKNDTFLCACTPDFEGLFCERVVEKSSGTVAAIIVPLITVLVIATVVILFLLIRRRMKNQPYGNMKKQKETFFRTDETPDA